MQWLSLLHDFIQLKFKLKFHTDSNPAWGVWEIHDDENFRQWS